MNNDRNNTKQWHNSKKIYFFRLLFADQSNVFTGYY